MSVPEQPPPAPKNPSRWYVGSAVVALVFLALIIIVWNREYNTPAPLFPGESVMRRQEDVTRFMRENLPPDVAGDALFIPTGVVIQTLEFKGPYTVQAGGYIWQKYPDEYPPLDHGFVFAEAESTTFTKVYETHQDGETLVGWNFKTTLREKFDYSKYPLDRQLLWLRLWHVEFEKDVYLVPDIAGYDSLAPGATPGLDEGLVLENWELGSSYFSFRLNAYNSNFGIQGYNSAESLPELYFNVPIQRYILSPLVARGIAPLVILIQLFVIVMVIGSNSKRLEQFGVRPGAVIFTCAAFFFAILLAQNALRDEVKWYGVVYLEMVHVLTYFVILAVAANSVALVANPDWGLFGQDNLWVEVLYWPLILGILLVITLLIFGW
ncbi:MAG: hypothetical protein IT331_16800 [Anaerolineae bacterium]|nr:hypothetical protein [Anaerolineae bacterium]